jgi:FkbM family methyltransferase
MTIASWWDRQRRSVRKRFNRVIYNRHHFVSTYKGADFLVSPLNKGGLEISAKVSERALLQNFMAMCAEMHPDVLIDVGANIGLYSCIIMKNKLAPRALLFEPDRRNAIYLRANLLINELLGDNIAVHETAVGAAKGHAHLMPGPAHDVGLSMIADTPGAADGYDVEVVRLDDVAALANCTLAIKIDVEGYELAALAGMERTLRDNRGFAQIEVFDERRDQVVGKMADAGFSLIRDFPRFPPNLIFRKD